MPATRLRRQLYRTETVVGLAAGVMSGLRGMAYLPPLAPGDSEVPPTLTAFTSMFPLWVYAVLWMAVLPMSVVAVWVRRMWVPTIAAFASLCALSGGIAVLSWLFAGAERGWLSAVLYGLLGVFIAAVSFLTSIAERQQLLLEPRVRGR